MYDSISVYCSKAAKTSTSDWSPCVYPHIVFKDFFRQRSCFKKQEQGCLLLRLQIQVKQTNITFATVTSNH